LANPGWLAKMCCWTPGLIIFPLMAFMLWSFFFWSPAFFVMSACLGIYTCCYSLNLTFSCGVGWRRIRQAVGVDWHAKLKALQAEGSNNDVMHIVFLPNYKEDEDMMRHTLETLAKSPLARESMYVVLAMEEREGHDAVRAKAANLIDSTRHLFADVSATFHSDLPGDLKGKASNCQWAYRQEVQRLAPQLKKYDPSQVFITCCDADNLLHPQYFSALSYQALQLPVLERVWTMWQPPIFLMRNLFSSPGPTRLSGYATILFELGGMTNQSFSPAFCYSTYTFTFALASHHLVDGWDRDVIAEDHHMWCKCYFASIWEQLAASGTQATAEVTSKVQLSPVYLPAISYLVESDDGWFASIKARFQQARRHSQGLAELSYVLLQYAHVLTSERGRLATRAHWRIVSILGKMCAVHIIASLHSLSVILATIAVLGGGLQWVAIHGIDGIMRTFTDHGIVQICAIFMPIPGMSMAMHLMTYLVVKDVLEGKLTSDASSATKPKNNEPVSSDIQGCCVGPNGFGMWQRLKLTLMVAADYNFGALTTMVGYGLIPASLASWSLLFNNGLSFNYVVGSKPKEA